MASLAGPWAPASGQDLAKADEAVVSEAELQRAIDSLHSDRFSEREAGYRQLVQAGATSLELLARECNGEDPEIRTRCLEAICEVARKEESVQAAMAVLERLASDPSLPINDLARQRFDRLTMTDEERAVEALKAAGVRLHLDRQGHVLSVSISRDRDVDHLRHLPQLRMVQLSGNGITDDCMQSISELTSLSSLSLSRTTVSDIGFSRLAGIASLSSLIVRQESLAVADVKQIQRIPGLRNLSLADSVGDAHLECLADAKQLASLSLSDYRLTPESPKTFAKLQQLRTLRFTLSNATDRQLGLLAKIEVPIDITLMSGDLIGESGWRCLPQANLKSLTLMRCQLKDSDLVHVGNIKALQSLRIYGAPITDEGLPHLKGLDELQTLTFYDTQVTEEGLEALKPEFPKLRYSRLQNRRAVAVPAKPRG
ncbi:hypothetical protein FYK55_14510 [Roseiconus nitratireducens]|uniref:Uncharacterized protein n=1 Tax=Roseiconus nitratireducens TaxID=2605748 RepID=A0A5M6D8A8_9BACT|nr:hypothetical protein FYK55_14510 [Roseiconus nitratireducens]